MVGVLNSILNSINTICNISLEYNETMDKQKFMLIICTGDFFARRWRGPGRSWASGAYPVGVSAALSWAGTRAPACDDKGEQF